MTEDSEQREAFFSRIGATHDLAEELATEFDSVAEFLDASFEAKLRAVVGTRQAQTIASEYRDFEHMRDVGGSRAFRSLDGVGGTSAMRVDYAYIRRTVFTPRDVLSAADVAEKMGFVTNDPTGSQAQLESWKPVRADGGEAGD